MWICKETKRTIARTWQVYEEIITKEDEAEVYKIAKVRQRSRRDMLSMNMVKQKDSQILIDKDMSRWMEIVMWWLQPEILLDDMNYTL